MQAINQEILTEINSLPNGDKKRVLAFIKGLKAERHLNLHSAEPADSVSEDVGENITSRNLISQIESLPLKLQRDLIRYLNKLKVQAEHEKGGQETEKPPPQFKPGFGGAKGLFKKLPDDLAQYSAAEDFEEYL